MRVRLVVAALTGLLSAAAAAEPVKRTRYPALSPDGKMIAFSYQGDLWTVSAEGGKATRITAHLARDVQPVFAPDGKSLVFASNRFGNYDLFTMPVHRGQPRRLTFHSAADFPSAFTPDGQWVLFYSGAYGGLDVYKVRAAGGEPSRLTWDAREREYFGSVSPDGRTLVYNHTTPHPATGGAGVTRAPATPMSGLPASPRRCPSQSGSLPIPAKTSCRSSAGTASASSTSRTVRARSTSGAWT